MSLVATILISALAGFLAAWLVTWRLFKAHRGEKFPYVYVFPGQLRSLSSFERSVVKRVFPGDAVTTGETSKSNKDVPLSTNPIDETVQFNGRFPSSLSPQTISSITISVNRANQSILKEPALENAPISDLLLADGAGNYVGVTPGAIAGMVTGANVMIVPEFPQGFAVFPSAQIIDWMGEKRDSVFKVVASKKLDKMPVQGVIRVYAGPVVKAGITVSINVDSADIEQSQIERTVPHYSSVFVSYARDDSGIVDRIIKLNTTGATFWRDTEDLKPGQNWENEIGERIKYSDIFQLFWSRKSMRSENVKLEWEYALGLDRPGFIMPVYWEEPLPEDNRNNLPPSKLKALHFKYIPVRARRRWRLFSILSVLALFMPRLVNGATAAVFFLITSLSLAGGVGLWYQGPWSKPLLPIKEAAPVFETSDKRRAPSQTAPNPSASAVGKQELTIPPSTSVTRRDTVTQETLPAPSESDLQGMEAIYGVIVDESGAPIPGATVRLSGGDGIEAETDVQGRYTIDVDTAREYSRATRVEVEVLVPNKVTGGLAVSKVETWNTGELNFTVKQNKEISHTYRWHSLINVLNVPRDNRYPCKETKEGSTCAYLLRLFNDGGLAREVKLRITVPTQLEVESILLFGLVNRDDNPRLFQIIREVKIEPRRIERTRSGSVYAIKVARLSSERTDESFINRLKVQTRLRRGVIPTDDLSITARLMSYLDDRGVKRTYYK